jgi:hypothetical protein
MIPIQLPLAPMCLFAIGKHPFPAMVHRPQHFGAHKEEGRDLPQP